MPQLTGVRPLFSLRYAIIVLVRAHARMRPGAAHGYCVGLIVPAILAGIVGVRSTWRGQVRYAVPSLAWRSSTCSTSITTTTRSYIMRFGLFTGTTGIAWPQLQSLWQHIEATGWDAACVTDHFMPNTRNPVDDTLECWTALSGLALSTQRLRIGTLVAGNTYRHPAVVAKMATTVDIMSGGRLICGIGAAWQRNEHAAYGIPFATVGERLSRLEEACQVLLGLWTQPKTTF